MGQMSRALLCFVVVFLAAKWIAIDQPWGHKDHYNFGGIYSTSMIQCLAKSKFSESLWRPHTECEPGQPLGGFYTNWSPIPLLGYAGWSKMLGGNESEWVYRSFTIVFSYLNFLLLIFIARTFFKSAIDFDFLLLFGSTSLFSIYLATHIDFIGELSTFFQTVALVLLLLPSLGVWRFAPIFFAMLTAWNGFFITIAWVLLLWRRGERRFWPYLLLGITVALLIVLLVGWIKGFDFFAVYRKWSQPGYVAEGRNWLLYALDWVWTLARNLSRYLGPLNFALLILATLWIRELPHFRKVIFFALPGVFYTIFAFDWIYVHAFHLHGLLPATFLLLALYTTALFKGLIVLPTQRAIQIIGFLSLVSYPWGTFKNIVWLDALNSVFFILVTTFGLWALIRKDRQKFVTALVTMGFVQISQMINYRFDDKADYHFCQEFNAKRANGESVELPADANMTRRFYCRP